MFYQNNENLTVSCELLLFVFDTALYFHPSSTAYPGLGYGGQRHKQRFPQIPYPHPPPLHISTHLL